MQMERELFGDSSAEEDSSDDDSSAQETAQERAKVLMVCLIGGVHYLELRRPPLRPNIPLTKVIIDYGGAFKLSLHSICCRRKW